MPANAITTTDAGNAQRFARDHGVRLAFEMHPGFVVYNPATLLRLRDACGADGEAIGANLDPSHLFWQGIDLEAAIPELGRAGAIFHVHAKDTAILRPAAVNGVLDTVPLGDVAARRVSSGRWATPPGSSGDASSSPSGWLATTSSR
jgi:sugar phosphate isomerase/epimerase